MTKKKNTDFSIFSLSADAARFWLLPAGGLLLLPAVQWFGGSTFLMVLLVVGFLAFWKIPSGKSIKKIDLKLVGQAVVSYLYLVSMGYLLMAAALVAYASASRLPGPDITGLAWRDVLFRWVLNWMHSLGSLDKQLAALTSVGLILILLSAGVVFWYDVCQQISRWVAQSSTRKHRARR